MHTLPQRTNRTNRKVGWIGLFYYGGVYERIRNEKLQELIP